MSESPGRRFMADTRYEAQATTDQEQGFPAPPLMAMLGEVGAKIELPAPGAVPLARTDFSALVAGRRSRRRYRAEPLSLEQLSYLLWCSQGVKEAHGRAGSLRNVPSAGARHAFETLLVLRRVEGIEAGSYQYDPFSHRLLGLPLPADTEARIFAASYEQSCVEQAAALFVWIAIASRMNWRYGERGYRYLHLDAGHVCQNLYLGAEALGLGTVAVAAFDDDAMNAACGVDGVDRFVIYLAPVGLI